MNVFQRIYFFLAICCVLSIILIAKAQAKTVPIIVDHVLPDPRPATPVKFGVPFPRGELKLDEVKNVRVVDSDGNVIPHQARITATWNPNGSDGVRWLLIDTVVDKGKSYSLQFNQTNPPAPNPLPPIATANDKEITINTGPIEGTVPKKGGHLFDSLTSMGAPLCIQPEGDGPMAFNGLYIEHEKKGIFRADLDPDATVVLEESGPVRATLKADGWYVNTAGEKFCRYSVRMHFFRGRQDVKLEHTFIFTGISDEDRLKSVSLQLNRTTAAQSKNVVAITGGENLLVPNAVTDASSPAYFIQDQSERGRFDYVMHYGAGNQLKIADHGGGWLSTRNTVRQTDVAIRDAWQQYPYEFEIEQGAVRVHFWPKHGRLFDTSWDAYFWQLTDRQKRYLANDKLHKETDLDVWMTRLRKTTSATGAAKTHEIWLSFTGDADNALPTIRHRGKASLAREVAYPVLAHADPAWTCSTRALDFLPQAPKSMELFRDEENYMQALLKLVTDAPAANDMYGWWDWGAYHQHMNVGPTLPRNGTYADDAGQEAWLRARPRSHYGWGGLVWLQAMRTGQRDWLRYAQTYTLYSADRAHVHHTGNKKIAGQEYHYDNSEVPWLGGYHRDPGGTLTASNLQGKDDYVYEYWLTGDRRPLDVLLMWGEMVLADVAAGGKWGTWKPGFEVGNDIRNAGMNLHRVMMCYQATWDPRYLALAKKIADAFKPLDTMEKLAQVEDGGTDQPFDTAKGWAYEGMWLYWNVTRDEEFKKSLLAFIDRERRYEGGLGNGYGASRAFTYGYQFTKDELFLDLARNANDRMIAEGVSSRSFEPGNKINLNAMLRSLGTMATAPKQWRDANLPTYERGRHLTFYYFAPGNNYGMKETHVYFNERTDADWSFDASFSHGGRIVVYRPDGKIATEQTLDRLTPPNLRYTKLLNFKVPKDSLTGTYVLQCVEPSAALKAERDPGHQPWASIIRSDLPYVIDAPTENQFNPFLGRAIFFRVLPSTKQPAVVLGDFHFQRDIELRDLSGDWHASTHGVIPTVTGTTVLSIPRATTERTFGLFFDVPPDKYFDETPYPVRGLPGGLQLQNIPPYVAANPEDYFIPKIPTSLVENTTAP